MDVRPLAAAGALPGLAQELLLLADATAALARDSSAPRAPATDVDPRPGDPDATLALLVERARAHLARRRAALPPLPG